MSSRRASISLSKTRYSNHSRFLRVSDVIYDKDDRNRNILVDRDMFYDCYKAKMTFTKQDVVVKELKGLTNEVTSEIIDYEVSVLAPLSHPSITKLVGFNDMCELFIYERADNGTLREKVEMGEVTLQLRGLQIVQAIIEGLGYLHSNNIFHLDLTSYNITLDRNWNAKITNIGTYSILEKCGVKPSSWKAGIRWKAPEAFQDPPVYNGANDIYSLGAILLEIATGKIPWFDVPDYKVESSVRRGHTPKIPRNCCSPRLKKLIKNALCLNPANRMIAQEFLERFNCINNRSKSKPKSSKASRKVSRSKKQEEINQLKQLLLQHNIPIPQNLEAVKAPTQASSSTTSKKKMKEQHPTPPAQEPQTGDIKRSRSLTNTEESLRGKKPESIEMIQMAHHPSEGPSSSRRDPAVMERMIIEKYCLEIDNLEDWEGNLILDAKDLAGTSLLGHACEKGDYEIAQYLLTKNVPIDPMNDHKITPLFAATQKGFTKIVRLLLSYRADPAIQCTKYSKTALHTAVDEGFEEIAEALLSQNAALINIENYNKETPLHLAAFRGNENIVKMILAKFPDVDHKNLNGVTPLHYASAEGHWKVVQLLLDAYANPTIADNNKITPVKAAKKRLSALSLRNEEKAKMQEMIRMLESAKRNHRESLLNRMSSVFTHFNGERWHSSNSLGSACSPKNG